MNNLFWSFVRKESLHILRDPRTMLVVLLIPVMLMVLFGFAVSNEVNNIRVAVVADHRTPAVKEAAMRLDSNPYITLCGYISGTEIDHYLRSGRANAVVVFDHDYDRQQLLSTQSVRTPATMQIVLDAADASLAATCTAYIQAVLSGAENATATLFSTHLRHNPQMKSAFNFVPGIMGLIFFLICAMMTSVSIVREKETGTMEVLLVSPVQPFLVIVAKMVPYLVISLVNLATILLLAHFLLEVPLEGSISAIIAISVIYLLLALALGLFISTMVNKQIVALLMSAMVLLMPIMMFSGMLFPIENLPPVLKQITLVVPTRWYIIAMKKLMIEGLDFAAVWRETLILTVMTIAVLIASLKMFNDKLE